MSPSPESPFVTVPRQLLVDLVDTDDCQFDHHGYCQAHVWLDERPCPHARAKTILAGAAHLFDTTIPDV